MDGRIRRIIHCDCDCFYAAVEMRDAPSLRAKPVAVGGRAEQRGVIAACNYEARAHGVHSAMATWQALLRCPSLVLLPPNIERYRAASRQVLAIYRQYTALVEPLSLDEAYLDVTGVDRCGGSASRMANEIRARISAEVGITASAGIAPNKFLAKVASDWNKPNGQFVVTPAQVDDFVSALPVAKLFGVGRVMASKLSRLGVENCGQLRAWTEVALRHHFGRFGATLYQFCRGNDPRAVEPDRVRKSLSVETTFAQDLSSLAACRAALSVLVVEFNRRRARIREEAVICKLVVKLKFGDFSQTTAECIAAQPCERTWLRLLEQAHARRAASVRLLGIGVRYAETEVAQGKQLDLFADLA